MPSIKSLGVSVAVLLCACTAFAKDRNWQTGRVLNAAMSRQVYDLGSVSSTSGTATASGTGTANMGATATTVGNTTTMQGTAVANSSATARGQSNTYTAIQRAAVRSDELLLVTEKYIYVIEDTRSYMPGRPLANALNNRHHGCRYIVGEDIKYSQEKGFLWVLDPDGRECKVAILRQQVK
jgi:hypothetical protein